MISKVIHVKLASLAGIILIVWSQCAPMGSRRSYMGVPGVPRGSWRFFMVSLSSPRVIDIFWVRSISIRIILIVWSQCAPMGSRRSYMGVPGVPRGSWRFFMVSLSSPRVIDIFWVRNISIRIYPIMHWCTSMCGCIIIIFI